jgi:NAD(P)-dependent dehydrogenase (short-subunit alcohol dehydrogenase family)
MDPQDKVAVVTGGGSGIGFATAKLLAAHGARIAVADIDARAAERAAAKIAAGGAQAHAVAVDVADAAQVKRMLAAATERFGRIDIVHNNAGITERGEDLFAPDAHRWEAVLDIDLRAVILGTQLAVQHLRHQGGGGVIVNTASMAGLVPTGASPVYAAAKAGVVHFTRTLANLASEGIRVNAVCPTYTDTPMVQIAGPEAIEALKQAVGGILQPEQVAEGVLELVRDDSRAGAVMRVTVRRGLDYAFER